MITLRQAAFRTSYLQPGEMGYVGGGVLHGRTEAWVERSKKVARCVEDGSAGGRGGLPHERRQPRAKRKLSDPPPGIEPGAI